MTIRLTKDLKEIVANAVNSGRFARESDVIREALVRLAEQIPTPRSTSSNSMTREEFDKRLVDLGLMSAPPDTEADFDDPLEELVEIQGEPLSETVLRERKAVLR